eukprot:1612221-Pyramimonas_sp.AAC.1
MHQRVRHLCAGADGDHVVDVRARCDRTRRSEGDADLTVHDDAGRVDPAPQQAGCGHILAQ